MADSLLTTLCSICHISPPQYRCPRCDVRTCSLGCVRKHKAWAQCSGTRDATAYVPRSRLRTAAGVDHDYNFLHGIELATERAERVLVEERGVVRAEELRPPTAQEVRWRTGRDGRRRRVLVTRVLREARGGGGGGRVVERHLAARLARLNIEMACAPTGMSRQRENLTTLNRRTGRINWQVEWFSWGPPAAAAEEGDPPARTLSKVMDDVPLCRAYHGMLEERERAAGRLVKRAVRPVAQSAADATWQASFDSMQDPGSAKWIVVQGPAAIDAWPEERDRAERGAFDFYLAGRPAAGAPDKPAGTTTTTTTTTTTVTVARLEPGDCLRDVLANTRVLEFPTIYVLRKGAGLPAGFVPGPKDFVQARAVGGHGAAKREGEWSSKNGGRAAKRRRGEGRDGEELEGEDGDRDDDEDGEHGGHALEEGDVIAEQDLMGEGGEEEDDDDDTSSSGSDSDA
ncbi:Box C/D snoRNA protein 1 [Escovopsis weberi]|uniref:Box C/D snoRNA protein 1 n=1 Tax=Escovopsis weberi TaxID=150374 RepID=A0A0M9VXM5_ESCWE|nr:Box C/D snoRNA protein 1 [Escovopsis weberi]